MTFIFANALTKGLSGATF